MAGTLKKKKLFISAIEMKLDEVFSENIETINFLASIRKSFWRYEFGSK